MDHGSWLVSILDMVSWTQSLDIGQHFGWVFLISGVLVKVPTFKICQMFGTNKNIDVKYELKTQHNRCNILTSKCFYNAVTIKTYDVIFRDLTFPEYEILFYSSIKLSYRSLVFIYQYLFILILILILKLKQKACSYQQISEILRSSIYSLKILKVHYFLTRLSVFHIIVTDKRLGKEVNCPNLAFTPHIALQTKIDPKNLYYLF